MDDATKPDWLALKRKIPVKEAAALNDVSEDSPSGAITVTSSRK